eukprot:1500338-Alexandrium_andersonii.AAC.1
MSVDNAEAVRDAAAADSSSTPIIQVATFELLPLDPPKSSGTLHSPIQAWRCCKRRAAYFLYSKLVMLSMR